MSWQKSPLTFEHQRRRPALGIACLQGQDLLGERAHASRGVAGLRRRRIWPLRYRGPRSGMMSQEGLRDFDGFGRVVNLPDNAARSGVFVR